MDTTFEIGGLHYDLDRGAGAVPDVQNIDYLGFVGWLRPSTFLSLVPPLSDVPGPLEKGIREGLPIGMPYLVVNLNDEIPTVHGHEGRHRMRAAKALVDDMPLPVAFLLHRGDRARHVTLEHLHRMALGMLCEPEDGMPRHHVPGPIFERVRLMGEEIVLHAVTPAP